jgi:putative transcription antitermination factor YqgF
MHIIALDISRKKIGIAVSNMDHTAVIRCLTIKNKMNILEQIIARYRPFHIIIGMPTHPDGKATSNGTFIQNLIKENQFLTPFEYVDEYRSTHEAKQILEDKKMKIEVDSLVATIMIYRYLKIESALLYYGLFY